MALALTGASDQTMGNRTRKPKNALTMRPDASDFVKFVERTAGVLSSKTEDSEVEDVRRILAEVRTQYDQVHLEAEKREAELQRLREAIRVADMGHGDVGADSSKKEDLRSSLESSIKEYETGISKAQEARKVYQHMFGRIQKEQSLLKEKLLVMEAHLGRKKLETNRKVALQERLVRKSAQVTQELDSLEQEIDYEKKVRQEAVLTMEMALGQKSNIKDQRKQFDEWRKHVALDAATQAFNASAGRLRKLYAIEKLAGNCLQKITFEQVERSQTTEDGFQKIREVTGLTDVMDIVHKFLSREEEHEQLKSSVKEAEQRSESLREQFERFKRDTSGMTEPQQQGDERKLYMEVEEAEAVLNQALTEHEQSRVKLQQSTLQIEHMKRWANRVSRSLALATSGFQDCSQVQIQKDEQLPVFYQQLQRGVDAFIRKIVELISSGKVQRKNMSQAASKEYHEARRLLADKDFLKANCRVPASLDMGALAKDKSGEEEREDKKEEEHQQERKDRKEQSANRANERERRRPPRSGTAAI